MNVGSGQNIHRLKCLDYRIFVQRVQKYAGFCLIENRKLHKIYALKIINLKGKIQRPQNYVKACFSIVFTILSNIRTCCTFHHETINFTLKIPSCWVVVETQPWNQMIYCFLQLISIVLNTRGTNLQYAFRLTWFWLGRRELKTLYIAHILNSLLIHRVLLDFLC